MSDREDRVPQNDPGDPLREAGGQDGAGPEEDPRGQPLADVLAAYRREVLHWNHAINLISRRDPDKTLDALMIQCLAALESLPAALVDWDETAWRALSSIPSRKRSPDGEPDFWPSPPELIYVDIGSGAGIPGLLWHARLWREMSGSDEVGATRLSGYLVEPRGKKAWFLARTARLLDLRHLAVVSGRWEEVSRPPARDLAESPAGSVWLLSLKALKMKEEEIIAGWRRFAGRESLAGGERLLICRFLVSDAASGKGGDVSEATHPASGLHSLGRRIWICEPKGAPAARMRLSLYAGPDPA
jgi:hypothetical protein